MHVWSSQVMFVGKPLIRGMYPLGHCNWLILACRSQTWPGLPNSTQWHLTGSFKSAMVITLTLWKLVLSNCGLFPPRAWLLNINQGTLTCMSSHIFLMPTSVCLTCTPPEGHLSAKDISSSSSILPPLNFVITRTFHVVIWHITHKWLCSRTFCLQYWLAVSEWVVLVVWLSPELCPLIPVFLFETQL